MSQRGDPPLLSSLAITLLTWTSAAGAGDSTDALKGAAAGLAVGAGLGYYLSGMSGAPIASTETEPGLYHYLPDQVRQQRQRQRQRQLAQRHTAHARTTETPPPSTQTDPRVIDIAKNCRYYSPKFSPKDVPAFCKPTGNLPDTPTVP